MRNFILGIIVTLIVLVVGGLGFALLGLLPTRANSTPPEMEVHLAMSALDNSVDRHAPHTNNPVPITDDNLIDGLKIYTIIALSVTETSIVNRPCSSTRSIHPRQACSFTRPTTRNGTPITSSATVSATRECPHGTKHCPTQIFGK